MSELAKRLSFSAVAIPLVLWLTWLGGAPLAALLSIAAALSAYEFYKLAIGAGSEPLWGHGVLFSALIPLLVHARFNGFWTPPVSVVMLVVLELLTVALWVRGDKGKPLEVVGITLLGVFYTGGMLAFGYAIRYHEYAVGPGAGTILVSLVMILTWATDTGAMFVGKWFGRRKLMPSISPAKTVEGATGGLILAVVVSVVYSAWPMRPVARLALPVASAVLFGAVVSVSAQIGDLVESMLKREAGVKDSSALIPGHGGALDRVDSLLFAFPVGFLLLSWLLVPVGG